MGDREFKRRYASVSLKQLALLVLAWFLVSACSFVVDEREKAVVLLMGKPVKEIKEAGIYFKVPWPFSTVRLLEKRLVAYDSEPKVIPTKDKKYIVADLFALIYIDDAILFLNKVDNMPAAMQRVDTVIAQKFTVIKRPGNARGRQRMETAGDTDSVTRLS
jgi:membrane protease subunit HflC